MSKNKNKNKGNTRGMIATGRAGKWAGGRVLFFKVRVPWATQQSKG